jgi:hypothetical protein
VSQLRSRQMIAIFAGVGLLVTSLWYLVTKPERDADRLLQVLRCVQVGRTSKEDVNKLVQTQGPAGVRLTCSQVLEQLAHRSPTVGFSPSAKPREFPLPDHSGYQCIYDVQIRNTLLNRLRLAPLSGQFAYIWTDDKVATGVELHSLIGRNITNDDFGYVANIIYRQIQGRPACGQEACVEWINPSPGVVMTVSSSASLSERNRFLALNTACFARLGGCKNARDLLPIPEIR